MVKDKERGPAARKRMKAMAWGGVKQGNGCYPNSGKLVAFCVPWIV